MSVRAGLRLLSRRTADSVKRLSSAHSQCEIAQLMRSCPPLSSADVNASASSLPSLISARHFVSSSSSDIDSVKEGRRSKRQAKGGEKARGASATAAAAEPEDADSSEDRVDVAKLHDAEINSFIKLSPSFLSQHLPEGLPGSAASEFEATGSHSLLVRQVVRECVRQLKQQADGSGGGGSSGSGSGASDAEGVNGDVEGGREEGGQQSSTTAPSSSSSSSGASASASAGGSRVLVKGLPGSGKSLLLLSAVLWARSNGWLVLYWPRGRDWTDGGVYHPHPQHVKEEGEGKRLWDTPVQALTVLKAWESAHSSLLSSLPCLIPDPLTIGETPGAGLPRQQHHTPGDPSYLLLRPSPEWSLLDLLRCGVEQPGVAVSAVVRLRRELVEKERDVPVLIATDELNSWFTFSAYLEATGDFSRRQIHASELRMVNAYRTLGGGAPGGTPPPPLPANVALLSAFSESIAVGKLPRHLPALTGVTPLVVPRFNLEETTALVQHYCQDCNIGSKNVTRDSILRTHFLSSGKAGEVRGMVQLL